MSEGDPGGGKKERKKEDVLNTLLNKSPSATMRLIISFSIAPEHVCIWEKFLKVAKREGGCRGRSEVIIKALEEYVKRHNLGNPVLTLLPYVKPEEPQPMRVLCLYCQGALTEGKVFCQKVGMWVPSIRCYSCKFNRLRKKK